ncbi:MAG: GspH/FimT family pseudopilin [Hylemonella sp.]|nr:GspH/FimT family pseudopilin [Hylemonella sp.]
MAIQTARRPSAQGFTLVETMVVVAIMALLAAMAVPTFQDAVDRYRSAAVYDDLRATFVFARSEAIRRRVGVVVQRRPGAACATVQEWQCGWTVFADIDADNIQNPDGVSEPDIRRTDAMTGGTVVNMFKAAQTRVNFDRWGNITPLGAFRMSVVPRGDINSAGVKTMCASAGGRFRSVEGDVTNVACSNQ